ncbi:MAG: hypothetical protein ACRCUH_10250 [Shewanella sp.]
MLFEGAPEGATHYVRGSTYPFEKRVGDDWFYWSRNEARWVSIYTLAGEERIKASGAEIFQRPAQTTLCNGEGLMPIGKAYEWFSPSHGWLRGTVVGHDGIVTLVARDDGYEGRYPKELRLSALKQPRNETKLIGWALYSALLLLWFGGIFFGIAIVGALDSLK